MSQMLQKFPYLTTEQSRLIFLALNRVKSPLRHLPFNLTQVFFKSSETTLTLSSPLPSIPIFTSQIFPTLDIQTEIEIKSVPNSKYVAVQVFWGVSQAAYKAHMLQLNFLSLLLRSGGKLSKTDICGQFIQLYLKTISEGAYQGDTRHYSSENLTNHIWGTVKEPILSTPYIPPVSDISNVPTSSFTNNNLIENSGNSVDQICLQPPKHFLSSHISYPLPPKYIHKSPVALFKVDKNTRSIKIDSKNSIPEFKSPPFDQFFTPKNKQHNCIVVCWLVDNNEFLPSSKIVLGSKTRPHLSQGMSQTSKNGTSPFFPHFHTVSLSCINIANFSKNFTPYFKAAQEKSFFRQEMSTPVFSSQVDKVVSISPSGTPFLLSPTFGFDIRGIGLPPDDDTYNTCIICLTDPIGVVSLPCRHFVVCEDCFQQISKCPSCRQEITGHFIVKYS